MLKYFLFIILICIQVAAEPLNTDYTNLWHPPRDQADIGSCHTFAAIALYEAEYASQFGKKIDLSEAHIFVRWLLGDNLNSTEGLLRNYLKYGVSDITANEGGFIEINLFIIQDHGLVTEEQTPYTLAEDISRVVNQDLFFYKEENPNGYKSEKILDEKFAEMKKHINKYTNKIFKKKKIIEPDWVKQIAFKSQRLPLMRNEKENAALKKMIHEKLKCRPIAIAIRGQFWEAKDERGPHALVIGGYDAKKKRFIVRNSWGNAGIEQEYEYLEEEQLIRDIVMTLWLENPKQQCLKSKI